MPRYIDADKVIELIRNYGKGAISDGIKTLCPVDDIIHLARAVDYIPTANVTEVKRGEWIATNEYMTDECSLCKSRVNVEEFDECTYNPVFGDVKLNYCPHCGAKMEGEWN